jgi:hypothetical protein
MQSGGGREGRGVDALPGKTVEEAWWREGFVVSRWRRK